MVRRALTLIVSAILLTGCGSKAANYSNSQTDVLNNFTEVRMSDCVIYRNTGEFPCVLDYKSMQSSVLCNIPNCSHTSSTCIANTLKSTHQLPIVYNNCIYYFLNEKNEIQKDGKRDIELKTTVMKFSLSELKEEKVCEIDGYNANCDGGRSYLIGEDYYFTVNNGNPIYDESGNVIFSSNSGKAVLYKINLSTEELTDYGELFDFSTYSKKYKGYSIRPFFIGRNETKLYFSVLIGSGTEFKSEVYTFDTENCVIEKYDDMTIQAVGDGYISYYSYKDSISSNDVSDIDTDRIVMVKNIETGETTEVKPEMYYNLMSIYNGKLWCSSECFDLNKKKTVKFTDLESAIVIGVYNDDYMVFGYDEKGNTVYQKISIDEIEKLF